MKRIDETCYNLNRFVAYRWSRQAADKTCLYCSSRTGTMFNICADRYSEMIREELTASQTVLLYYREREKYSINYNLRELSIFAPTLVV